MTQISEQEWEILKDLHLKIQKDLNGEEFNNVVEQKRKFFEFLGKKYGFNPRISAIKTETREIIPLPDNWS